MNKNKIQIKNIIVELDNKVILKNISLDFHSKKTVCVIGEGSSGKTTLLKSLVGLVPIKSGEIFINGTKLDSFSKNKGLLNNFGVVFQKDALFDSLLVWQNIMFKKLNLGLAKEQLIETANFFLKKVGMDSSVLKLYPNELSGGMKKRVAIARAVSDNPNYLILDEPTAGLDPIKTNRIFKIIKNLANDFEVSVFTVTSDMKGSIKYYDELIMLRKSKIHWKGSTKIVKKQKDQFLRELGKKA